MRLLVDLFILLWRNGKAEASSWMLDRFIWEVEWSYFLGDWTYESKWFLLSCPYIFNFWRNSIYLEWSLWEANLLTCLLNLYRLIFYAPIGLCPCSNVGSYVVKLFAYDLHFDTILRSLLALITWKNVLLLLLLYFCSFKSESEVLILLSSDCI